MHDYQPSGYENENPASLLSFFNVLFRRKWIIISFFCSVVLIVTIGSFLMPPVYEASSKLLLERELETEKSLLFRMNIPQQYEKDNWINSEIEIIKSHPVAALIVKKFGLDRLEEKEKDLTDIDSTINFEKTINKFYKKFQVENLTKSNIVELTYKAKDPQLSAAVVNAVIGTYITYRSELSDQSDMYDFFEEQIQIAGKKVSDLEQSQADYKQINEVISPEAERQILTTRLADYDKSLTEVRTKRIGTEAKLAVFEKQMRNNGEISIPITESSNSYSRHQYIAKIKGDLLDMEIRRERLVQEFKPQFEEVVKLDKQIATAKEKIKNEIQQIVDMEYASIQALLAEEAELENMVQKIKIEVGQLAQKEYEFNQLSRGIDDNRDIYSMLLKQREEARISLTKQQRGIKIKVISPATVPTKPVTPRKILNIALSIFLGLFGGLGLAFFIEYFDHSINSPAEFEKYTGLNVLGFVRNYHDGVPVTRGQRRQKSHYLKEKHFST